MDTKSLAKSKRAHSQHHKKHHPNQKAKAVANTVGSSSAAEKAPTKAVKEKPRQSQGSAALPSNWDRYEDEDDDSMVENQIDGQPSQPSEVVLPKSKGADYAYLISEAKSQNSTRFSSEIFPSIDDFISDFGQGKDSFFTSRGESLLSAIQNDSFLVEDKTSANYQASFLSLNLHNLSEQLAKIDLSKRLYLESDLFPPELYSVIDKKHDSSQDQEARPATTTKSHHHHHTVVEPMSNSNPESVAGSSEKQFEFKAETAEAELDLLLDSFVDANLKEKSSIGLDIDSTLDDLLNETSAIKSTSVSFVSPSAKSQVLDDFDSWLDTI